VRDKARLACMPVRYLTDRTDSSAGELVDPDRYKTYHYGNRIEKDRN
jgi:hypothetical protein